jgi:hypothetical protein
MLYTGEGLTETDLRSARRAGISISRNFLHCSCPGAFQRAFDFLENFWRGLNLRLDLALLEARSFAENPNTRNYTRAIAAFAACTNKRPVVECLSCNYKECHYGLHLLLASCPAYKSFSACRLDIEEYVWLLYEEWALAQRREDWIPSFRLLQKAVEVQPWHQLDGRIKSQFWESWSGRFDEDERRLRAFRTLHPPPLRGRPKLDSVYAGMTCNDEL